MSVFVSLLPRFSGLYQLKTQANRADTQAMEKMFTPAGVEYEVVDLASPILSQQLRDNQQLTRMGYLETVFGKDASWLRLAVTDDDAETLQGYQDLSTKHPQGIAHTLLEDSDMRETMKQEMRSQDYSSFKLGYFAYAKQSGQVKTVKIPYAIEHVEPGHPRQRTLRQIDGAVASRYLNSELVPGKDSYLVVKPFNTLA